MVPKKLNSALVFFSVEPRYNSKNCLAFNFYTLILTPTPVLRWVLHTSYDLCQIRIIGQSQFFP
jgi:hypothetical protein